MNDSFGSGEKIVTSYRNTKNFDDNWISASYGIHWLRTVRYEHRARSVFRLATRIQGTGFLFPSEVIKDGWKYTSLTEDRAFCADVVTMGYRISYNNQAEFYDEQPTDIKIAMRQRLRWAKGHLEAFVETGGKLFLNIFRTKGAANKEYPDAPKWKKLLRNLRFRFINFDMLTVVFPRSILLSFKKIAVVLLKTGWALTSAKTFGVGYAPELIRAILKLFGVTQVFPQTDVETIALMCAFTFAWTVNTYIETIITAAYVMIAERKRIKKMRWYKKVWYCITFPIFDLIGKLAMLMALFMKVEWKPIPHKVAIGTDEVK
jgi:cellulose synthase/poly-beta-1,6-N-acetylglucosamine synthase-like glycosyltransferase